MKIFVNGKPFLRVTVYTNSTSPLNHKCVDIDMSARLTLLVWLMVDSEQVRHAVLGCVRMDVGVRLP